MDVFEYAMQMEKDGEAYYRSIAAETESEGLRTILTFLADEEVKHYNIFKKMRDGKVDEVPESSLISDAKNIFQQMKESGETFDFKEKQVAYYEKAMQIEQDAVDLYLKHAEETDDPGEERNMRKIAEEEKRHYRLFESIRDFVQRPEQWLEDAEWNHLDEY
jgi:rubrerythrin